MKYFHLKSYGGWVTAPRIRSLGARGEWSALRSDCLTPREQAPGTHCVGRSMSPRHRLDHTDNEILLPLSGIDHHFLIVQTRSPVTMD
jgi:hypothetical protein